MKVVQCHIEKAPKTGSFELILFLNLWNESTWKFSCTTELRKLFYSKEKDLNTSQRYHAKPFYTYRNPLNYKTSILENDVFFPKNVLFFNSKKKKIFCQIEISYKKLLHTNAFWCCMCMVDVSCLKLNHEHVHAKASAYKINFFF